MHHKERRRPYEFPPEVKKEALEKAGYACEQCGRQDNRTEKLQADHRVAIWFARESKSLAVEVIKSIANCQILCQTCHSEKHKEESRAYYEQESLAVLQAYFELVLDHSKDDWREQLKRKYAA